MNYFKVKRLESTTRSPIYSSFGETISGASLIRAYKAEDRFITDNFGKVDFNLKARIFNTFHFNWPLKKESLSHVRKVNSNQIWTASGCVKIRNFQVPIRVVNVQQVAWDAARMFR